MAGRGAPGVHGKPAAGLPRSGDARSGEDDLRPAHCDRAHGKGRCPTGHRRVPHRASENAVVGVGRARGAHSRPRLHERARRRRQLLRRSVRHIRASRGESRASQAPHRFSADPRHPRRDPPRRRRPLLGRRHTRGLPRCCPAALAHRHALQVRRFADPVRRVCRRRRRRVSLARRLHVRVRRSAARRRCAARHVPQLLGADAVADEAGRRRRSDPRRASDQRHDRAGLADRPQPRGRLDPGGPRGRRRTPDRRAQIDSRCRRPCHRHRSEGRPRIRGEAGGHQRPAANRGAIR